MSDSPNTGPSLAGHRFAGRYQLEQQLGAGSSGDTYRAKHVAEDRTVVVKVLHEDLRGDALRTSRFEWEATTLGSLSHPNIPAILDFGVSEGRRFVVREWLEGESLADRVARGPLPLEAALTFGRQLLAALGSAHATKLLHRNIRPSNLFLERRKQGRERVKLLDFAPARLASEPGARESLPLYAPPEHLAGEALDVQSDVFAVGKLMRDLLTEVAPGSALERWLVRATAEQKHQRFSDAGHMLRELVDILPRNLRGQDEPKPKRARAPLPFTAAESNPPAESKPVAAKSTEIKFEPPTEPVLPVVPKVPPAPIAAWKRAATALPETSPVTVDGRGEPGTTQLKAATAIAAFVVAGVVIFMMPGKHSQAGRDATRLAHHQAEAVAKPRVETKAQAATKPAPPAPIPLSALRAPNEPEPVEAAAPVVAQPTPLVPSQPVRVARSNEARNPWLEPIPEQLKGIPEIAARGAEGDETVMRKLRMYNTLNPDDARGVLLVARFYLNRNWRTDGVAQIADAIARDRSARGAPEILPALLNVIAEGRAAADAEAVIDRVYGSDAIPAIDRALETVTTPIAVARLSALSAKLITRPPGGNAAAAAAATRP